MHYPSLNFDRQELTNAEVSFSFFSFFHLAFPAPSPAEELYHKSQLSADVESTVSPLTQTFIHTEAQ